MDIKFDLGSVKEFVKSADFSDFLVNNTTFGTAAFVLQTLLDKINELEGK